MVEIKKLKKKLHLKKKKKKFCSQKSNNYEKLTIQISFFLNLNKIKEIEICPKMGEYQEMYD